MRVAYCTNVRLPSERAHGHQIAKVTEALKDMGHEIEIFAPYRKNIIDQSFESYYGLTSPIRLHHLGSTDGIAAWWAPGIIGLKLTTYLLGNNLRGILKSRPKDFEVIYTRTPELLPYVTGLGIPVILELHRIPRIGKRRFLRLLRSCKLIVALTSPMRQALIDMGVSDVPVIVEGDGVDLHDFETLPSPKDTRTSLNVADGVPLIVYAGQLKSMGLSKGIPELLFALELLHDRGLEFRAVIAGGPESEKKKFVESMSEGLRPLVNFTGHIAHLKIPTLLTAADILVYPAPKSDHLFYTRDTSPLKLFEYMAAGKPIVAADLPPLRDVVDPSMVTFSEPGSGESLSQAILMILEHREESSKKARLARAHVEQFTWENRMERILKAARLQAS
ncbi:MAG: glycosyltransferase family 4 protein [Candidatus Peribacteraceae bacterium]|nr:glycosyltransferase family 4 protein [Candidatus Peribacteraceae bacterium]